MEKFEDGIGLAEYLTDLRAELSQAQSEAVQDSLKLGVEEIRLTLDVAYTLIRGGEASAGVRAKFWVLEFGEASATGSLSNERVRTQQLMLVLKPRVEELIGDDQGQQTVIMRGLDVEGGFAEGEQQPKVPASPRGSGA